MQQWTVLVNISKYLFLTCEVIKKIFGTVYEWVFQKFAVPLPMLRAATKLLDVA